MFKRLFSSILLLWVLIANAQGQFESFGAGGTSSVSSLIPESKSIVPGCTVTVALQLKHPGGWHSYYRNSGGVELPPSIEWKLPEGFSVGPIQWPVPEVKDGYFGKSLVYTGSPVFLVDLSAPATLEVGSAVAITAHAKWQICKESCINEERSFSIDLLTAASTVKDETAVDLFTKARAALPIKANALQVSATPRGANVELRIKPTTAITGTPTDFIPNEKFIEPASVGGQIVRDGDAWVIKLKRKTKDALDVAIPPGNSISGILAGPKSYEIPETKISAAPPASVPFSKYLPIIGGMLLGGLILNLMPCVFPVIGLKIMGFVQQAGHDRRKIAVHGITFALGVFLSFAVLSGILFAIRESGSGWGFQLQNPWVVLTLLIVMFVLGLNLAGLFEIGTSATSVGGTLQSKTGLAGSFFSGVLATIVATPCSGPFLGAAIGAAFALPAAQFFTAFAAMALGLALPYLILSIFPKLIDFLPRPGAWMESFKQAMSFLLFATAGYLLWVYAGQIGLENLLAPILGICAMAVAAWIYGRWNLPHRPRTTRWTAASLALIFAATGIFLAKPPQKSALVWEHWSQERVDELLEKGTPVYIDFTAQWCATCQVNKKRAYTPEVIALMKAKGIVALKADKTSPDPAIEAKLQELGRTAIPVNVLLLPEKDPQITSELLSPADLKELFNKIPDR